jgi:YesN/AraC family two-component response regulator
VKRILIIDDDFHVRDMMERLLRRAGYDAQLAENGVEAVKMHRENPMDLVITDIIMPEKEGLEIITEFRRDYPSVKLIAISGGGRISPANYLKLAKLLGAERTYAKPVDSSQLLSAIKELLAPPEKSNQ